MYDKTCSYYIASDYIFPLTIACCKSAVFITGQATNLVIILTRLSPLFSGIFAVVIICLCRLLALYMQASRALYSEKPWEYGWAIINSSVLFILLSGFFNVYSHFIHVVFCVCRLETIQRQLKLTRTLLLFSLEAIAVNLHKERKKGSLTVKAWILTIFHSPY